MSYLSAITRTIRYARHFSIQLSPSETADRLISPHYYQLNKKITHQSNNYLHPIYTQKVKIAQNFAHQIKNIFPDILFLAVTGSVAAGYPRPSDDIDFLIITRSHALWLTRLRLFFFLHRHHLSFRRFNQQKSANLFCFNLWLDQSALSLPPSKQNLRNAVDLVLLKPLVNRHQAYQKFLLSNSWAKKYVCTPYTNLTNKNVIASPHRRAKQSQQNCRDVARYVSTTSIKILNSIAFLMQLIYMLPKITTETITLHSAFFHPKRV